MDRFESNIEVDAAPSVCYKKWHQFEQFPHFMKNVEEVQRTGDKSWHWVVTGPLGHRSEWDAVIDGDVPNQMISWHSLTGSEVTVSGVVNFKDLGQNRTEVTCQVQYDPPAGVLGELVAHLFVHPEKLVQENLVNFKHLVEGTNVPVEKVHTGRVMHPDPFVVPSAQNEEIESKGQPAQSTASAAALSSSAPSQLSRPARIDEEGYELIYGLEDDLPNVGTSAELDPEDIEALQLLNEEESPYLGLSEGAVYSEDLIDMRNDNPFETSTNDIYAESMDVFEEDLASYTENIDSDIDAGLGPKESFETFGPNTGMGPRESADASLESVETNSSIGEKGG